MVNNINLKINWLEIVTTLLLPLSGLAGFTTGGWLRNTFSSHIPIKDIVLPAFYLNLFFFFPALLIVILYRNTITLPKHNRLLFYAGIAWISLFLWGFFGDPWLHQKIHLLFNK